MSVFAKLYHLPSSIDGTNFLTMQHHLFCSTVSLSNVLTFMAVFFIGRIFVTQFLSTLLCLTLVNLSLKCHLHQTFIRNSYNMANLSQLRICDQSFCNDHPRMFQHHHIWYLLSPLDAQYLLQRLELHLGQLVEVLQYNVIVSIEYEQRWKNKCVIHFALGCYYFYIVVRQESFLWSTKGYCT